MTHTAIVPRTKKKAPSTRPGVKGATTKAIKLKLLKGSSKGIDLPNIDFIAHAFAGIGADEVPWVAGFPGDVANADHRVWFGSSATPMPRFVKAGHNNYIAVSSFKRAEDGKHRRRKECGAGLWMVLLDDLGTKVPFDTALRLHPSCLLETSPGNFQAWLFLAQPERDPLKAQALIDGLIKAGASDPGAGNLTRYGRLPTGINGKAKYAKDGQPFTQRVHVWAPDQRYTPAQIAQAYGFDLEAASKPRAKRKGAKPASANRYVDILDDAGLYLRPITSMHGAHQIICPWWEQHTDKDQTGSIYFEPDNGNGMKGGFKCQHGHCAHRTIRDLDWFVQTLLRNTGRAAA